MQEGPRLGIRPCPPRVVQELLGPARFKRDEKRQLPRVGLVRGLAYTSVGG